MHNWHIISGITVVFLMFMINLNFVFGESFNPIDNKIKTLEFSKSPNIENFPIQYPDISQIMSNQHSFLLNNKNYTVFDILINLDTSIYDHEGKISSMSIGPNKNSILINFDNILQSDSVELRFNNELIPTQNKNFTLIVDGGEKEYSLATQKNDIVINFVIPRGTHQVELIGTRIIPEFGSLAGMIMMISIIGVIIISTRFRFIRRV